MHIEPVLVTYGPFQLTWHGILTVAGILAGFWFALREAQRVGISQDDVYGIATYALPLAILGARLFHVADNFGYYSAHPLQILMVQEGGLAIYGGLAGGILGGYLYVRSKKLRPWLLLDVATPALLIGQMIGRIGCTINGDAWGAPTNLPWGIIYTNPNDLLPHSLLGVPTHPYPIYEILWDLLVLGGVLALRGRVKRDGVVFLAYASAYSVGRFFLTFVRQEPIVLWGLQEAQVLAFLVLAVCLPLLVYLLARPGPVGEAVAAPGREGVASFALEPAGAAADPDDSSRTRR